MDINLYLKQLSIVNFKNYETAQLQFSPVLNCLVGENGMGKTNLLDAIHLLCVGRSHFMTTDRTLVRLGEDFFRVVGRFERLEKAEEIVVKYKFRSRKIFERNKSVYKRLSDHLGLLPLVIIAPDDAQLILEGSKERRRFMDFTLVQLDNQYMEHLLSYNKVLDQRNALLKSVDHPRELNVDLLHTYNLQLIQPANYIYQKRKELLEQLTAIFSTFYQEISGGKEEVSMEYTSQLEEQSLEDLLQESEEKDSYLQRTTKGIHKDDITLKISDQQLKKFASQGQLKSYLLAMKLAQYELLKQEQAVTPLLLLDDIFDKLDAKRVKQLLNLLLKRSFGQIFITDTHEDRVDEILKDVRYHSSYKKFLIKDAQVVREEEAAIGS